MHQDQAQKLLDTAIGIILAEGYALEFKTHDSCICQLPHPIVVKKMKDGWPDPDDPGSPWRWSGRGPERIRADEPPIKG